MQALPRTVVILTGSITLLLSGAHAAELARANNNTSALNTVGAWAAGAVPGVDDVMLWNNTFTVPTTAAGVPEIGGDLSVLGLKVTNVGGTLNAATTMVGYKDGATATGSTHTLTIGASGIDMSAATQALILESKITLGASQSWAIANANTNSSPAGLNNGEDLALVALAPSVAFNLGGNTLSLSGAGQITITAGYTIDNGTINIGNNLLVIQGGTSRVTTINSNVTTNLAAGATLRLQSNNTAPVTANGAINLDGGTLNLFANSTAAVTINGNINVLSPSSITVTSANTGAVVHNGNLTGSAALGISNTTGNTARPFILAGDNSGYTGTVSLTGTASSIVRLTSATAGSASAIWSVGPNMTLQLGGVAVELGTLNGSGTINNQLGTGAITVGAGTFTGNIVNGVGTLAVTKNTTGTLTLGGNNTYTGATVIDAGTLVVTGSLSGTSSITVRQSATLDVSSGGLTLGATQMLRGGGSIIGNVSTTIGTKISPGESVGTLTLSGNLNLTEIADPVGSAGLLFELDTPGASDQIAFTTGVLNIGTGVLAFDDFVFTRLANFTAGTFTLFDGVAPIIGNLHTNPATLTGSLGGGFTGTLQLSEDGNDLLLLVVPEPGTAGLLLPGLSALLGLARFRRRAVC